MNWSEKPARPTLVSTGRHKGRKKNQEDDTAEDISGRSKVSLKWGGKNICYTMELAQKYVLPYFMPDAILCSNTLSNDVVL